MFVCASGMAPITYNERVADVIAARKKVERGIATQADREALLGNRPITSNYFDLSQLEDYWSERRSIIIQKRRRCCTPYVRESDWCLKKVLRRVSSGIGTMKPH